MQAARAITRGLAVWWTWTRWNCGLGADRTSRVLRWPAYQQLMFPDPKMIRKSRLRGQTGGQRDVAVLIETYLS